MSDSSLQQQSDLSPSGDTRLDEVLLEFGVCAMSAAVTRFGTLGRATLFVAAARACGPFSAHPLRPISVNALAASLGRPFETTRRNANLLIDQGLLARSEAGLSVPAQAIEAAQTAEFIAHCHDLLVRLVEDARAGEMALRAPRAGIAYDSRIGAALAFDLLLAGFECHGRREPNQTRLALLTTIEWANTRFGDGHEPAPVKPSTVARVIGLPYATVARNLDVLVLNGALTRRPTGLVTAPTRPARTAAAEARLALANRARQLLGRLAQAGFPMDRPSHAYLGTRPSLPALG